MKIGAVILSRYNSKRLPGKALLELNGRTVIETIVERLHRVISPENIIVATSEEKTDQPIVDFAKHKNINYYRGSLQNVAERFYYAARSQNWDYAIRINGDNIFVDTDLLQEMIEATKTNKFDFISNVKERTYPKGMSIEIVKLNYYHSLLNSINKLERYKEHVTLYLYENEGAKHFYFYNTEFPEAAGIQLALDTIEDFERTKKILSSFPKNFNNYNLKEIVEVYKKIEHNEHI